MCSLNDRAVYTVFKIFKLTDDIYIYTGLRHRFGQKFDLLNEAGIIFNVISKYLNSDFSVHFDMTNYSLKTLSFRWKNPVE